MPPKERQPRATARAAGPVTSTLETQGGKPPRAPPDGSSNVAERSRVRETMWVVGSDGADVGEVKAVRDDGFLIDRRLERDVFAPFAAVKDVHADRVMLTVAAGEVESADWAR